METLKTDKGELVDILHIHRYLANEASKEQRNELEQWLMRSGKNREHFESIRKIYELEIRHSDEFNTQTALVKFKRVMNDERSEDSGTRIRADHFRYSRRQQKEVWLKSAAIVLISMAVSLYAVFAYPDFFEKEQAEIVAEAAGPTLIETKPGEQKSFRLSDGSRIYLNASSSVHIPVGFGEDERSISLTGEAFFDIVADPDREFVVETKEARVSVLGTSFSIRAWGVRDESIIAVEHGVVSVRSANLEINEETILTAGDYSQIRKGEAPGPALQENFSQYLGWKEQRFVFEETPLRDVLHQLEIHFNVRITVDDSMSMNQPVTARYSNESLEEILKYTSITHEIGFQTEPLD